jgi:hypothetical protein
LAATISSAIAIWTYLNNSKRSRFEWLSQLFKQFYGAQNFKEIRLEIEYGRDSELKRKIDGGNEKLEGQFVDYLNFFEFIGTLQRNKLLNIKEVDMLFRHPLSHLRDSDYVNWYIKKRYRNLKHLLVEFKKNIDKEEQK